MKGQFWSWCLLLLLGLTSANSCDKDPVVAGLGEEGYFVFGNFYGLCAGDDCIRIFKFDDDQLYADTKKVYPNRGNIYNGSYKKISNPHIDSIASLLSGFPQELLSDTNVVFGCPDCVDQGVIYLELKFNDIHRSWLLDNVNSALPEYLRDYAHQVQRAIDLSRGQ